MMIDKISIIMMMNDDWNSKKETFWMMDCF